jgi:hypothetical protein
MCRSVKKTRPNTSLLVPLVVVKQNFAHSTVGKVQDKGRIRPNLQPSPPARRLRQKLREELNL